MSTFIEENQKEWNKFASSYDKFTVKEGGSDWQIQALETILKETKDLNLKEMTVLDFGCGSGALTLQLAGLVKEIVAFDIADEMTKILDNHLKKKNIENVTTCSSIDFMTNETIKKYGKFDLVISGSVLTFCEDINETLDQLATITTKKQIHFCYKRSQSWKDYLLRKPFEQVSDTQKKFKAGFYTPEEFKQVVERSTNTKVTNCGIGCEWYMVSKYVPIHMDWFFVTIESN